jgi:2-dehydropantoate 2-reductase
MRILILGAGAIGGYYGLHLAQAGADVSFLVRPGRAAQLEHDGLVVWTRGETRQQRVQTLQAGEVNRPFDAVFLACKAYDLASAIEAIAPAVGPASVVVPLLNGLAHLDVLDTLFGAARVLGGVAYIATSLESDGTIRHASPMDTILFGDRSGHLTSPVEALAAAFATTPIAARASETIVQDLWEKWCMLAAGAAITCLMRGTVGEVMATEDGAGVAATLIAETRAIAAGHGHAPRPAAVAQADRTLRDPQSRWAASMMRDIQQGAPRLEAEHVIGDLLRRGRQVEVAAPLLAAAYAHLQVYNARGARRPA